MVTETAGKLTLNISEACTKLGISEPSLRRAIKRGEIPILRIGRRVLIPINALEKQLLGASV